MLHNLTLADSISVQHKNHRMSRSTVHDPINRMSSNKHEATASETTPLLAQPESDLLDAGNGIAPEGPHVNDERTNEADDSTLQRRHCQQDQQNRSDEYEGLPEVRKQLKYIFPAIVIGVYLSAADQTIVVSSYGRIGTELDALNLTSWIATAFFLTLTSFQPLYGKLSDIFGRKVRLKHGASR